MFFIRLATLGLVFIGTPVLSAQQNLRSLPPTPVNAKPSEMASKSSMGMQILKNTSQFMIQEFEYACKAHISNLKSLTIDPVKPDGYGTQVQYYTQNDKIGLIGNLNSLLKKTTDSVNAKLSALESQEVAKKEHFSDQDILKNFRDIYGILNEGRKNCTLSLSQIEKQTARTKTLKDCQKDQPLPQKEKTGLSQKVKKALLGSRSEQKKNQQTDSIDTSNREAPTTNKKAKKILGTKETREEEKQRVLLETLKKSGLS